MPKQGLNHFFKTLKYQLRTWLERYDQSCERLGLLPGQKRSCVPYRTDAPLTKEKQTSAEPLNQQIKHK
ncbi:MAG: hypothetical protein ACPHV3_01220 [Vibrio sp.]